MNTNEHLEEAYSSKAYTFVQDLEQKEAYSNKAYTFVQDLEQKGVNSIKGIACKNKPLSRYRLGIFL